MRTALVETLLSFLLLGAALFGGAGRFDWPMAWLYLAANLAFAALGFLVLDPELIRERALPGGATRRWDRWLASSGYLCLSPLALLVAGLDAGRFGWSPPLPRALELGALGVFALGNAFALWAARTNRFFSSFVRIQTERGHRVVTDGPYAFMRHPGYAGGLLALWVAPLALGSLWGLLPASVGIGFFVARTAREDRVLHEELAGYREYAARVRWRLIPGVW
jgi:protein-S-isoprenylcysteine O-methyltransferase Ste14